MYKTIITLLRGQAAAAEENLIDANALTILDQQMRDATAAFERAKRALAIAIGQDRQEGARLEAILTAIADLEIRVTGALSAGSELLAREGAEAIARLEADRDAAISTRSHFSSEISRLRRHVSEAQARLAALDRGRRVARAAEAVRHMRLGRLGATPPGMSTLTEAESTLKRLRERQQADQAAEEAFDQLDATTGPAGVAEKLAAEGFGRRLHATADDVLQRLKARAAAATNA